MTDITKKITKLDEKIDKLKERIKSDTAECEKLAGFDFDILPTV